jgi:hypothetical protein
LLELNDSEILSLNRILLVNFISRETLQLRPYAPLIQQIRHIRLGDWNVSFQRTFIEDNECFDWLAKTRASSNNTLKILNSCPPQLGLVLLVDIAGVVRL